MRKTETFSLSNNSLQAAFSDELKGGKREAIYAAYT
jgi:hypothetical protein